MCSLGETTHGREAMAEYSCHANHELICIDRSTLFLNIWRSGQVN
jgi:hypothetical protein